jgi:hypothetical protein
MNNAPILTLPSEVVVQQFIKIIIMHGVVHNQSMFTCLQIRGHIFNLLSSNKDITNCRVVCHQFKSDVDEFVDFSAELDETKGNDNLGWFLPRILSLRLKEIIVKSLVGPPCLFGMRIFICIRSNKIQNKYL